MLLKKYSYAVFGIWEKKLNFALGNSREVCRLTSKRRLEAIEWLAA